MSPLSTANKNRLSSNNMNRIIIANHPAYHYDKSSHLFISMSSVTTQHLVSSSRYWVFVAEDAVKPSLEGVAKAQISFQRQNIVYFR